MKKALALLIGCLCMMAMVFAYPIGQNPDESSSSLVVWHKDGSKVIFNLSETPKITYTEEKVIIKASSKVEYDFQSIKKMTYESESVDGITNLVINQETPFKSNGETITFLPSEKDLKVKIVALNGVVIKEMVVKKGEPSSFYLDSCSAKIYMIVVNGVTYKIKIK